MTTNVARLRKDSAVQRAKVWVTLLGAFARFRHVTGCPHGTTQLEFDISVLFENLSSKSKLYYYLTRIKGTLRKGLCTFMLISR